MSCSMEMALWFEKCYEEKENQKAKEFVPENGKEAIVFIKNYIKENYSSLDIIPGGGIKYGKCSSNWSRIKHSKWRNSSVFDGPFLILEDKEGFEGVFTTPGRPNLGENLINGRFFGFTIPYCGRRKMFNPKGKHVYVLDDIFKKLV